MFNLFKRVPADPSLRLCKPFNTLRSKEIIKIYLKEKGDPEVIGVSGFDSVVRLNSTYLELVDRYYNWRGGITLVAGVIFCMAFFGCFLSILLSVFWEGGHPVKTWLALIVAWCLFALPVSWAAYRLMITEAFFSTYYPIRFNRKNGMVYVYQAGGTILAVPWRKLTFILREEKQVRNTMWSILGCITAEDGETVTSVIPLPVKLHWGTEFLDMYWEFIRCYMEEGDEYLPDLADAVPWCPPVDNQKEGWLFGLLYLSKQTLWVGWLVNLPLFPVFFVVSFSRWLVMLTSKVPVWPDNVTAACQPEINDPVSKGPEDNPPQLWRRMLALQKKEQYRQSFAKERSAVERIVARLKEKYGRRDDNTDA